MTLKLALRIFGRYINYHEALQNSCEGKSGIEGQSVFATLYSVNKESKNVYVSVCRKSL